METTEEGLLVDISILETATPLLRLCRRRACLLRKTLEALATCAPPLPKEYWILAGRGMGAIESLLDIIEQELDKAAKEGADGQHGD